LPSIQRSAVAMAAHAAGGGATASATAEAADRR
jgi:hypothetical protein